MSVFDCKLLPDHQLCNQTWHTSASELLKVFAYVKYYAMIILPSNHLATG